MVFRRLYLRLPACTASPASSSFPTYFQDDTQQTFKINVFIFAINCILAGLTGIAVLLPGPVLAAESLGSAASQEYAIPAGRLSDVLAQFAATSGVQLVFDPAMLADLRSNGLQGRYTVQEGFLLLLANSGYELVDTGGGSYSLRKAPAVGNPSGEAVVLPLMTVSASTVATDGTAADGYRSRKVSQVGPWQGRELDDLPYSMTVLPAELLENVRGATVDQIFRINPTTQIGRLQVDNNQPNVLMRGFNNQSFYRDGLAGSRYNHDVGLENTERVEVLSGLSGFLYGPGNVGGIVNFITKRPTAERLNRLTARYNGGTNFHVHGDFGGPIDRDGRFGYRINAAYQDGELAVDRAKLRRTFLSAAFDWRVTDDLLLQAHVSDGDFLLTGAQTGFSLATGVRRPSTRDIDNTRSWGQPWSERYYKTTSYGANLRWEASDWLTLRAGWRENDSKRYQQFVNNTFQADGTYTQSYNSYGFGPDRNYYEVQEERLYQVFADIRFDTGTISHTLSGGIQRTHHWNEYPTSDMWQPQVTILTGARLENGPIYIPRPVFDPFVPHESIPTFTRGSMTLNLGDDIRINEQWSLLAGLAHSTIEGSGDGIEYDKSAITPSLSLIYKPLSTVTTYATYMESLEQGGTAASEFAGLPVVNAGEVMKPMVSRQYEIGTKWSLGGMLLSTALFQIDKALQYYDISNPAALVFVQDGRQQHRGLEFTAFGRVTEHWSLIGGLTVLDTVIRKQKQNPALEGKRPVQVAEWLAKLRVEYDTPWISGLTLVAGFNYTSDQYADAMNTDRLPSYTLFDAGARYVTSVAGRLLTLRFETQNLTDKRYWVNGSIIGDPRTFIFSASADF